MYSQDFLDTFGGELGAEWIDLHYEILYAKFIYYAGVGYGFQPMADEKYDRIEVRYKELSQQLGKEPTASDMVGWKGSPIIEALAMRKYNPDLYEKLRRAIFVFKE